MVTVFKEMGWLDMLAFGGIAVLVIRGFLRGCSGELSGLVGVLAAAATGFFGFDPVVRTVLSAKFFNTNPYAGRMIAFILILVVSLAVWLVLRRLLKDGLETVVPQPFDAVLGGVIGGVKAFVLVAVFCTFGLLNPRAEGRAQLQNDSVTVQKLAPYLKRITAPER